MTYRELGIEMESRKFGPDHVHIFMNSCKSYSVPKIAQRLKGDYAKKIRRELWAKVRNNLCGDNLWSDSYFHRNVSLTTTEALQYHIEGSQRKHWVGLEYGRAEVNVKEKKDSPGWPTS